MQQIAIFIVGSGVVGLVWGILQRLEAGRIASAPFASTGSIAAGDAPLGSKREISAEGRVCCPHPLVAPFSGTRCLFYSIKCTAEWKEGATKRTKVVDEQKVAAPFSIDDGSGGVWTDASEGGDFDPIQSKKETKSGGRSFSALADGVVQFGDYRVYASDGVPSDAKFTVEERALPVVERMYACGVADDRGGIAAPKWTQLVLSSKSRDERLASSSRRAKLCIPVGAAMSVIGLCIGIVDLFPQDAEASTESSVVASIPTTPAKTTATTPDHAPSPRSDETSTSDMAPNESDVAPATDEPIVRHTKKPKAKGKPAKKKTKKQAKTKGTAAPKS